jgi:hypothetical protein
MPMPRQRFLDVLEHLIPDLIIDPFARGGVSVDDGNREYRPGPTLPPASRALGPSAQGSFSCQSFA